ncbi:M20 peptidase family dipeptidase, partial [bacterium]|nr:M20 peptidase family dipeptidase [bacterium]
MRAFETGNPQSPANAIPPHAVVFGHLRYVVGTEVSQLMPLLQAHLDKHGFGDITITSERDPMYATRLDPDHPWAKWAVESLGQTAGEEISVVP